MARWVWFYGCMNELMFDLAKSKSMKREDEMQMQKWEERKIRGTRGKMHSHWSEEIWASNGKKIKQGEANSEYV